MVRKFAYRAVCAATLALGAAQSAQAAGFLYDCTMVDIEAGRGWVSPKIAIVLPGDGTAQVIDALTLAFAKEPVNAKILRDNEARLIVRWTLKDVRTDTGRAFNNFGYRASIGKATGKIELTAGPRHFDTGLRGTGTCAKRSQ